MKPARCLWIVLAAACVALGCEGTVDPMAQFQTSPPPPNLSGTWSGTVTTEGPVDLTQTVTATFSQNGTEVSGRIGADDTGWYELRDGILATRNTMPPYAYVTGDLWFNDQHVGPITGDVSETAIRLGDNFEMGDRLIILNR